MRSPENTLTGKIAFAGLALMCFGLAFSISIAQTGLGITLIAFVAALLGRSRKELTLPRYLKLLYLFLSAWVIWRIVHIALAAQPLAELREAREVWLMLIPLFIWLYGRNKLGLLLGLLITGAAISSTWGLYKMREELFNSWARGHGLSTMHHLNYAGVTALASLLGLGLAWSQYYAGKKLRFVLLSLLAFLALAGLWLTKSRGALAAFAVALPFFIYFQLSHRVHRWLFLLFVILGAGYAIPRLPESLAEQYRFPPPEVHAGSQAERRDLWLAGIAMIRDNVWLGYGERGYNEAYPRYQVPGATGVAAWDEKTRQASHMHNDFLNTWVLYGAVGLIIQLGFYFLGLLVYWRERFHIRLMSQRPMAAAGAAAIVLMALMGLTQCHFTSEIVQMSFWAAVGSLFAVLDRDRMNG